MSSYVKKAVLIGIIIQLIASLFPAQWANAATVLDKVKLEGTIVDAQTGEALPAAHLIIKDTYTGTITNADGAFEITAPTLPVTLVARFIGYESVEVTVREQKNSHYPDATCSGEYGCSYHYRRRSSCVYNGEGYRK